MKKGFTLVEIMVASSIFFILIGVASGIFFTIIQSQRRSLASQELLDQTSYVLEYMARALRMARKELSCTGSCDCLDTAGYGFNYETNPPDNNRIRFLDSQNICQEFFLEDGVIKKKESSDHTANFGTAIPLTSDNLVVESFKVGPPNGLSQPVSWDQDNELQPRVTLLLKVKRKGGKPELQPEITIQTTLSQRNLDLQQQ